MSWYYKIILGTWAYHPSSSQIISKVRREMMELQSPLQNPAEPKIGQLKSMVKKVMQTFHVPLSEHDWAQKWCIDVHNTAASRKLAWKSPLEVSTGNTQDISPFRFHL
eukprot:13511745-Ditylum_brightwellii.AAC.1